MSATTNSAPDCPFILMDIPLELRYKIFEAAAERHNGPQYVLAHWFEKIDTAAQIAEIMTMNPSGPMPVAKYRTFKAKEEDSNADTRVGEQGGDDDEDDHVHNDDQDDDDENSENNDDGDGNDDDDMVETNDDPTVGPIMVTKSAPAPAPAPAPRAPIVKAAHRWRHVPKFMSITPCPPPTELLLANKEIHQQAMNWYYEVAVLRIHGTASFAHLTMFEESLEMIADTTFSPLDNIRKAEVTLVWDTAWIRASGNRAQFEAILPAFLRERVKLIVKVLKSAPMLRNVVIHWHDSIKDNDTEAFKSELLRGFYKLPVANIHVQEYYIAPDEKPYRKSPAGRFRLELMEIADRGTEYLYTS